ncbi:MAG: M4 family metallopeptidase, partial [Bdellovibrionales bacterium]|nr:M4 family metallopeptidase [Bdellovibrionales bacterium]
GPDPLIPDVNALEEAFGDLVGELYEFRKSGSADWKLGTFYLPEEPFRDLANPYNSQEPNLGTYSKRYYDQNVNCDEGTENGGYYLNSTIVSHALYLAANGGELNGCEVTGRADGEEFATRIFARAWLTYFDSQESFAGAYAKLLLACQDLYSFEDCLELEKALQAVQLDQPGACSTVPESGPACAVQHGGSAVSCRPDATVSDLFAPTENIWTDLSAATPYETVDVYYVPNDPDRPKWQVLSTVALDSRTDVPIDGGGIAATDVTVASTPGTYDIIIDGNQDGMFQPWADSVTTLNVQVPVDGDGLCYAGESYATGENCHDSPSDCGCDPGYFCKGVYNQGAPEYSCARIRIGHGCFLSGTQITMADGSTKPIESIDVGDEVRSLDPDTGEFIVGQVRSLSQANVGEYLLLNGKTKVTSVHRFYVPKHAAGIAKTSLGAESGQLDLANGEWIEIGKLPIGTMLLNSDGELVELKSLEPITASDTPVYNFEVYPQPNYIADGIVVHNRKPERIIAWEGDGGGGGGYAQ